ncbi:hypothetical protein AB8616_09260 [Marinomonas sp. RS-M-Aa-14]|uniref:hypothetical protein n=1 Tax=Marinomonas sp. RS-M-Aa-14 TaxID=3241169 RepID=UPI003AAA47B9
MKSIKSMANLQGVYRIKGVFVMHLGDALFVNVSRGRSPYRHPLGANQAVWKS